MECIVIEMYLMWLCFSPDPESDIENLHILAYEHLKSLTDTQRLVKCDDGPIAEHIEQITTSEPIAVSLYRQK